jgi:hypothetical protein
LTHKGLDIKTFARSRAQGLLVMRAVPGGCITRAVRSTGCADKRGRSVWSNGIRTK